MTFFSLHRNYATVLLTILCIVFLGAAYFLLYIPANEKRLKTQRHLSLQNIDKNIHEKIDNSLALMNNLLKGGTSRLYLDYLRDTSQKSFSLSLAKSSLRSKPLPVEDTLDLQNVVDGNLEIKVDDSARQVRLVLTKTAAGLKDTAQYRMTMRFSFQQFFEKLLPKNVFEEYVVFKNREAVYTTARSGVNNLKDSLFAKGGTGGTLEDKTYTLAGTDYKLFAHPVSSVSNIELVIAGLVSEERYQQERKKLPYEVILFLVTALLAIVIAFPWIKLYHMGSKDRLRISDAVASIVASMLLMSLLFFAFFKYNRQFRPEGAPDPKEVLAAEIGKAFQQELDSVYEKLKTVNEAVEKTPQLFDDFTIADSNQLKAASTLLWQIRSDTATVRQVLWLAANGDELVNWTPERLNAPHSNYSSRAYYRQIVENKELLLNGNPARPFYLDQVVSRIDGKFTSVLSIHSNAKDPTGQKQAKVAAISFRLQSLHQPLLAPGYLFAVIDKSGKVLYYSDESRNLNEDLVTELSAQEKLRSALEARVSSQFVSKYFGKQYNLLVSPLGNLPYSVVIFSDLDYRETREMAIYSFTFSMFVLLCLFFVVQLFAVFVVSSKRSFFKKQLYDTSWVAPKVSSHHQYNLAIMANGFAIFLAVCFFKISTFLTYVFILLFTVSFVSFFLNRLFAKVYKEGQIQEYHRFKITTLWALAVFMAIMQLIAIKVLDGENLIVLLIYESTAVVAGFFFYYQGENVLDEMKKAGRFFVWLKKRLERHSVPFLPPAARYWPWNYSQSFGLMALTRLVVSSGIPVVFFYLSAYNYEQNISVRYRQWQYAAQLLNRLPPDSLPNFRRAAYLPTGVYADSSWIAKIGLTRQTPSLDATSEDRLTSGILDFFRFNFTDIAVNEDRFSVSSAADTAFQFNPLLKDACKEDSTTVTYVKTRLPGEYLAVSSARLNYQLPSAFVAPFWKGGLFWLLLAAALFVFYFIVHNILAKLFCLRLPDLSKHAALDDKIIGNQRTNNLLFAIGLPGSGKLKRILKEVADGHILDGDKEMNSGGQKLFYNKAVPAEGSVLVADLITIQDSGDEKERTEAWNKASEKFFDERYKLIVVNHFEYNIQDAVTNRIKLNFLERLMLANTAKVIILSTIHPTAFLDSAMGQAVAGGNAVSIEDLERWHVLFGHYRIVVFPLQQAEPRYDDKALYSLYKETEYTHFLNKVQQDLTEIKKGTGMPLPFIPPKSDELIYKLQISAHYFYMYIWQSLTKEEKFLLYDLAEDNLVNSFDDYNLNMLLAKGVIRRRNGTLVLFNKGFRNFILTAIGNTEAIKIKARIKDNGKWGNLRTPLVLVMAAILVFLLASEEEAYSKLLTYLAALGAGIPAILKVLSFFDSKSQKE